MSAAPESCTGSTAIVNDGCFWDLAELTDGDGQPRGEPRPRSPNDLMLLTDGLRRNDQPTMS